MKIIEMYSLKKFRKSMVKILREYLLRFLHLFEKNNCGKS